VQVTVHVQLLFKSSQVWSLRYKVKPYPIQSPEFVELAGGHEILKTNDNIKK